MSTELGAANATTNTSSPSVTPAALQVINEQVAQHLSHPRRPRPIRTPPGLEKPGTPADQRTEHLAVRQPQMRSTHGDSQSSRTTTSDAHPGRFQPERVASFNRNGWPKFAGMHRQGPAHGDVPHVGLMARGDLDRWGCRGGGHQGHRRAWWGRWSGAAPRARPCRRPGTRRTAGPGWDRPRSEHFGRTPMPPVSTRRRRRAGPVGRCPAWWTVREARVGPRCRHGPGDRPTTDLRAVARTTAQRAGGPVGAPPREDQSRARRRTAAQPSGSVTNPYGPRGTSAASCPGVRRGRRPYGGGTGRWTPPPRRRRPRVPPPRRRGPVRSRRWAAGRGRKRWLMATSPGDGGGRSAGSSRPGWPCR